MSQQRKRDRENFLREIEDIVNEHPELKKKLQNLWLIPSDDSVSEQKFREINQQIFNVHRTNINRSKNLAQQ